MRRVYRIQYNRQIGRPDGRVVRRVELIVVELYIIIIVIHVFVNIDRTITRSGVEDYPLNSEQIWIVTAYVFVFFFMSFLLLRRPEKKKSTPREGGRKKRNDTTRHTPLQVKMKNKLYQRGSVQ